MFNFKSKLPAVFVGLSIFMAPQVGSAHAPVVVLPLHHAARLLPANFTAHLNQQTALQLKLQSLLAGRGALAAGAFRTTLLIKTTTANGITAGSTNTLLGNISNGQILDRFYEGGSMTGMQTLFGQEVDSLGSNPLNNGSTGTATITNTANMFSFLATKSTSGTLLPFLKVSKNVLPASLSGAQRALNSQYGLLTKNGVLLGNKLGNEVQGGLLSGYFYSGTAPGNFNQGGTYVLAFGNNAFNKASITSVPFVKNNYIEIAGKFIPIKSGQLLSTYYVLRSGSLYGGDGYNVYGVAGSLLNTPGHAPIFVSPSAFISYLLR